MNKKMKTAIMLLVIILIAALAISLSYSRYFTKVEGDGTATVAKWSFSAQHDGEAMNVGTITLGNKIADNDKVADGKIAPGTAGSVVVNLDATGAEVGVDYTIQFANMVNKPGNLKFYSDETHQTDITTNLTSVTGITGSIDLTTETKTKDVPIYWEWAYGEDVVQPDTGAGQAAKTVTFDVIVTGTQQEYVPPTNP